MLLSEDAQQAAISLLNKTLELSIRQNSILSFMWSAIESLPIGITMADIEGKILYTNAAEADMHGYKVNELNGKNVKIFAPADQWRPFPIEKMKENSAFIREGKNVDKSGRIFDVRLISVPIIDSKGVAHGILTLSEDISHNKKIERQRNETSALIRDFENLKTLDWVVNGIAHKFKNILSVIQTNMQLAQMEVPDNLSENIEKTLLAVARGKDVVNNLVNARCINGKFELIDLKIMIQQIVEIVNFDNKVAIDLKAHPSVWKIFGVPANIQQIIINLLMHAKVSLSDKKTRPLINISLDNLILSKGQIKSSVVVDEFVRLKITDNGSGMSEDEIRSAFDEPSIADMPNNSLTYLYAVEKIVKRHGGWIEVSSIKNEGTTFSVFFPAQEDSYSSAIPQVEINRGKETILLIEDEWNLAESTKQLLEMNGYSVYVAQKGAHALRIFKDKIKEIDLLITDISLPDTSGLTVIKKIQLYKKDIKIIVISGMPVDDFMNNIINQIEVLSKPFEIEVLLQKIQAFFPLRAEEKIKYKNNIRRIHTYLEKVKTLPYNGKLTDSLTVYNIFAKLAIESREKFLAVFLDSQKQIIAYDELACGTVNNVIVYPQEIIRSALLAGAVSIILVHNHPSGEYKPSPHDIKLTFKIKEACALLDIELTDHVIIARHGFYSFADAKML